MYNTNEYNVQEYNESPSGSLFLNLFDSILPDEVLGGLASDSFTITDFMFLGGEGEGGGGGGGIQGIGKKVVDNISLGEELKARDFIKVAPEDLKIGAWLNVKRKPPVLPW